MLHISLYNSRYSNSSKSSYILERIYIANLHILALIIQFRFTHTIVTHTIAHTVTFTVQIQFSFTVHFILINFEHSSAYSSRVRVFAAKRVFKMSSRLSMVLYLRLLVGLRCPASYWTASVSFECCSRWRNSRNRKKVGWTRDISFLSLRCQPSRWLLVLGPVLEWWFHCSRWRGPSIQWLVT